MNLLFWKDLLLYLTLSLERDRIIEWISSGSAGHIEPCRCWQHSCVQRWEGWGSFTWVTPSTTSHTIGCLVSQILCKLLVEPVIHQSLTIRVQSVSVTLVQTWVHLGPQVLTHGRSSYDGRSLVCSVCVLLHVFCKVGLLQLYLFTLTVQLMSLSIMFIGFRIFITEDRRVVGVGMMECFVISTLFLALIHNKQHFQYCWVKQAQQEAQQFLIKSTN